MDWRIFLLLNLAVYLEVAGRDRGEASSEFVYGNPNDGHRVARVVLNNSFESDNFKKLRQDNLGRDTQYSKGVSNLRQSLWTKQGFRK